MIHSRREARVEIDMRQLMLLVRQAVLRIGLRLCEDIQDLPPLAMTILVDGQDVPVLLESWQADDTTVCLVVLERSGIDGSDHGANYYVVDIACDTIHARQVEYSNPDAHRFDVRTLDFAPFTSHTH